MLLGLRSLFLENLSWLKLEEDEEEEQEDPHLPKPCTALISAFTKIRSWKSALLAFTDAVAQVLKLDVISLNAAIN